jgi:Zn-dependent protease
MALLAALVLFVLPISPQTLGEANVSVPVATILSRLVQLNVLLAVFNMIPIPPLDGGNVLAGLLPPRLGAVFNQIRPYGFLLLYALILTDGFRLLVLPPYFYILSLLPTQ